MRLLDRYDVRQTLYVAEGCEVCYGSKGCSWIMRRAGFLRGSRKQEWKYAMFMAGQKEIALASDTKHLWL